uniref:Coiled-coil domain-containing protein n=1 Tax=Angiostrongylus cantonensis TaxID=6313 RepID=A0A0K0DEF3_ANGCA
LFFYRCDRNDADFSSRHAEKLRRASELRAQLQAEKTARLRELTRRVEEVREKRQKIIERKRQLLESRMERAQENREKNITEIIRRAKDDEQRFQKLLLAPDLRIDSKRIADSWCIE